MGETGRHSTIEGMFPLGETLSQICLWSYMSINASAEPFSTHKKMAANNMVYDECTVSRLCF